MGDRKPCGGGRGEEAEWECLDDGNLEKYFRENLQHCIM